MTYSGAWFQEQARLGNMYSSCSAGAVTLSTVATACTGMALSNPIGSGKKLVVKRAVFVPSTAPAGAAVVFLAVSPKVEAVEVTHTTPAVIHNAVDTGSDKNVGVAKVDVSATLATAPVYLRPLGAVVAASSITPSAYKEDVDGDIILPPGTNLSFSYLTTAAIGVCAFTWVEISA